MLSSISSVLGLNGQTNYAAANYFQDSLAQLRCQLGLPATSVNLGVLGTYAGMSKGDAASAGVLQLLDSHGMSMMPLAEVLAKIEGALVQQPVQRMVARLDWARFRKAYPHLMRDARFIDQMSDAALARGTRPSGSSLRAALGGVSPEERPARLQKELAAALGKILGIAPDQLDLSASLDLLGLDSLMLSQLRNWVLRALDVNLPMIKLLKGPSIESLSNDLVSQIDHGERIEAGPGKTGVPLSDGTTVADLDGIQIVNPWLVRGQGAPDALLRLICFLSMGVGASLFTKFLLNPPQRYDILAVQTPGRENRIAEPVVERVEELVDRLLPSLLPQLDRPFVIWGHSFGGIVAGEVLRRLKATQRAPVHFVVSGTIAPSLVHVWQKREVMLKTMVSDNSPEYLISLSRYVDDAEFIKGILPLMRRDYPLLQSYACSADYALDCPMTAFAAKQDDFVYTDEIAEWARLTSAPFELREVDGDHWFLNRNRDAILAALDDIAGRFLSSDRREATRIPLAR